MYKKKLSKAILEELYQKYNRIDSADDPILFVINQKEKIDQELFAFIAAQYAFGNIKQINTTLKNIFQLLSPSPLERILDEDYLKFLENNFDIYHRFLNHKDFIGLLKTLNKIYSEFGSLKKLFLSNYIPDARNLENSISSFSNYLRQVHHKYSIIQPRKLKFLYPTPTIGSPCKRMNLFLRWMVRKDNLDLGLWKEIKTSQLIIPLDTHIFQVAKHFGLTKRKNPSWKMAVEITENLKEFDNDDPVKYDFALSHSNLIKFLRH